jgi:hypothetical protein
MIVSLTGDLFTVDAVRSAESRTARITCRVCDRQATVPLNHPALLCLECIADPEKTRKHVAVWLETTLLQLDQAKEMWEVKLKWSPAAPRWPAVADALAQVADKELDRAVLESRWQATLKQGGAMADLLRAYETYCRETDRLGAELARLERAQMELDQL